jgi:hypothetical protein
VVVHICNPSTQKLEAGGVLVQGQPGLHQRETQLEKEREEERKRVRERARERERERELACSGHRKSWLPNFQTVIKTLKKDTILETTIANK